MLTQELMLAVFDYREGRLHWKHNPRRSPQWNGKHAGHEAGCRRAKDGRKVINIEGKLYLASRLIFLFHKGYLPKEVDHEDRDCMNDRIENLRPADRIINNGNTNAVGVVRLNKKWVARIYHKGKSTQLGTFLTRAEANRAYLIRKKELGLHV